MPMLTVWNCSENPDGKTDCSIGFSPKEWVKPEEVPRSIARLTGTMNLLNDKLPSGKITVDEDNNIITISDINPKDVKTIKKKVAGKDGIKNVKERRGEKVEQTSLYLDQTMLCHQELSKDGHPLSVERATDPSPYDHLPYLKPTVIIVHTEKLLEEWGSKIESFLGIPRNELGQIGGGRKDHCFISLSTIQSMSKKQINDILKGKINLLISDEVHHSSADQWKRAVCDLSVLKKEPFFLRDKRGGLSKFPVDIPTELLPIDQRPKTMGLSATPTPYGLERTQILNECIGPKLINIKDSDIINEGYILPVKMIRESIQPEEPTKFITDFARLLSTDFDAEITEKMASAREDHHKKYNLNKFEKVFQRAVGGAQFTASAYDENKIKRAISRITETPDENFLVYSPRVIPLYAVTTLLRNFGIDPHVVPFIGKGSQNIKQYKSVKKQITDLLKELKEKEMDVEKKEREIERQGYESQSDKKFLDGLKAQAHFLKEIIKVGPDQAAREAMDRNVDWITSDPANELQMPLDDFYKRRRTTTRLEKDDIHPPAIVPQPILFFTAWLPRREFKPKRLKKYTINNSSDPWEAQSSRFNPAIASSMGRWRLLKFFNELITEEKNLKVATSIIDHDIQKEEFNDIKIRENFGKGVTRVLPLSTAGQEGVDIPNANNLIVMSIFTKPKDPIQLTGRLKRPNDGKKPGEALFLNIKGTSDDIYFRSLMKGLLLDVFETEYGNDFREELQTELKKK